MPELEVIHDPAKEMAAIVNVDTREGWGPAMIGPNAGMILQAFIDAAPFDMSTLSSIDAARAFTSFLDRVGVAAVSETLGLDQPSAQPAGDTTMADVERLAQHEAAAATDVPAVQPADTDMAGNTSQAEQVVSCVMCNGTGTVQLSDDQPATMCGMCKGSGKVTIAAATA